MVTTMPNTPPGTPPISFVEMVAFNPGGDLTDTHAIAHNSGNPATFPALVVDTSDAYGSWQRLGDSNQFGATFKRLLFSGANTPMALYGPFFPGQHVGFETVTVVLSLTSGTGGETLQGPFTVQFTNLAGQVTFADTGTVSAKRIPAFAPNSN
jgi:hypothetical protein